MAGSATDYLRQRVLSHTLAFGAYTAPAAVYVGLCAATPAPDHATPGSEVSGNAYARQAAGFVMAGGRTDLAENGATIEFPAATGHGWGTLGFFELWDAATAGNRLYWGPLVDPADGVTPITRTVGTGDIMRFTAGVLQVQAV